MTQPSCLSYTLGRPGHGEKGSLVRPPCCCWWSSPGLHPQGYPVRGGWEGFFLRLQGWKGTQCPMTSFTH